MNRNMMNHFSVNPVGIDISRSIHNMPSSVKFSMDLGELVPFYCQEILPGDSWSVDTSKVVRLQPLVTPVMDNIVLDTYYFFVPNRLVWNHWINFMGENTDSKWTPTTEYTIPKIRIPSGGFDVGTIADYLGVPPKTGAGQEINALPFRAVAMICDQWFRSENVQDPVHVTVDDTTLLGVNTGDQVTDIEKGGQPFIAGKLSDYFVGCLPAPQKGPSVTFNLAGTAPVFAMADDHSDLTSAKPIKFKFRAGQSSGVWSGNTGIHNVETNGDYGVVASASGSTSNYYITPANLWADMGQITQFSVNELRTAFAVQRYYERLARGGSRYIEILRSLFGVISPDARMQRAEYLGGNRITLNISTNEQTSSTESSLTPQGNVVGVSHTGNVNSDFTKSFTEHGYLIGLTVARIDSHTYQQGLPRHFRRNTVFEYYNPIFANLGEQAVMESEIYFDSSHMDEVFGYQEAWAEYRYIPNRVAGEMRSVYDMSLDSWHLADYYESAPSLSASWFREDKANLDRALAVTSAVSNQIICDFYIDAEVARPMPLYSIPGLIDHH